MQNTCPPFNDDTDRVLRPNGNTVYPNQGFDTSYPLKPVHWESYVYDKGHFVAGGPVYYPSAFNGLVPQANIIPANQTFSLPPPPGLCSLTPGIDLTSPSFRFGYQFPNNTFQNYENHDELEPYTYSDVPQDGMFYPNTLTSPAITHEDLEVVKTSYTQALGSNVAVSSEEVIEEAVILPATTSQNAIQPPTLPKVINRNSLTKEQLQHLDPKVISKLTVFRKVGQRKLYPCPLIGCTHEARGLVAFKRHLTNKDHRDPTKMCDACGTIFPRGDSLSRHRLSFHQSELGDVVENEKVLYKAKKEMKGKVSSSGGRARVGASKTVAGKKFGHA